MQKPDIQTLLALLAALASFYMTQSKSRKESQQEVIHDVFGSGYDMRVILVGLPLLLAGLRWYYASRHRVSVGKIVAQEIRAANAQTTNNNSRAYVKKMVADSIQKAVVRNMVAQSIQKAIANEAKMIAKHSLNTKNAVTPPVRDFVKTMAETIATRELNAIQKQLRNLSETLRGLRKNRRADVKTFTQTMTIGQHGYKTPNEQKAAASWKALNKKIKKHEKEYENLLKQKELLTGGFVTSFNA